MKNKKINIIYMLLVFVVSFNLRLGISSVPPIQLIIQQSLGLSNFQLSLLTGIPVVCMGIFVFLVKIFQKKYGTKLSIFYLLVLLGVSTFYRIYLNNYFDLIITTLIIGLSISVIGPILAGFIKEEFPEYASLLIGIFSFSMGVGSLVVSTLTDKIAKLYGWKFSLGVWGIFGVVAAIIWIILAPKSRIDNNKINIKINYLNFNLWKMMLFFSIQSGIFYGFSMWLIPFINYNGIITFYHTKLLVYYVFAQMFFGFLIPIIMQKLGTSKTWGLFSSFAIILGSLLALLIPVNLVSMVLIITLIAIGLGGSFPIAMIMPLEYSKTPEEASIVTGIVQAFGYVVGGIIPVIFGYVVDTMGDFKYIFIQIFIGSIIMFLLCMKRVNNKNN